LDLISPRTKTIIMTIGFTAIAALFGFLWWIAQDPIPPRAEPLTNAQIAQQGQEEQARREAAFNAMNADQHLAEVTRLIAGAKDGTAGSSASSWISIAETHLAAIPSGTPRKAAMAAELQKASAIVKAADKVAEAKEASVKREREKKAFMNQESNRRLYAKKVQEELWDSGINCDVNTSGTHADTMRIKWVLASKVTVYKFEKTGIIDSLGKLHFRRVTLSNGYDFNCDWDLK